MTDFIRKTSSTWIWKMVVVKFTLYSLVTAAQSWRQATKGIDLAHISHQLLSEVIIDVFVAWGIVMLAFLDQGIARTKQDKKEQENTAANNPPKLT